MNRPTPPVAWDCFAVYAVRNDRSVRRAKLNDRESDARSCRRFNATWNHSPAASAAPGHGMSMRVTLPASTRNVQPSMR